MNLLKKCKIGKGNMYLTENRLSRIKMWCAADDHNYMCHICAKELLGSNFNYEISMKLPQISHTHKNIIIGN